jgi:hypothetical protein
MLAPVRPDGQACLDAQAYCYASSCCYACPGEHVRGLASCMRERGSTMHTESERESTTSVPQCEREGGSIARIPMCLSGCMLHRGGTKPGVQGRLVMRPFSGALHACMHFTRKCSAVWELTAHCMHVQVLELARMTK